MLWEAIGGVERGSLFGRAEGTNGCEKDCFLIISMRRLIKFCLLCSVRYVFVEKF